MCLLNAARLPHPVVPLAQRKTTAAATVSAVAVAAVRGRLGSTQPQFAARFGASVATLRHWERGDRNPQGTTWRRAPPQAATEV